MSHNNSQDSCISEFVKAVPTNGFSDVDARVMTSLHSAGVQPCPVTPKPVQKLCKIFSPVSPGRAILVENIKDGSSPCHEARSCTNNSLHCRNGTEDGDPNISRSNAASPAEQRHSDLRHDPSKARETPRSGKSSSKTYSQGNHDQEVRRAITGREHGCSDDERVQARGLVPSGSNAGCDRENLARNERESHQSIRLDSGRNTSPLGVCVYL